MLRLLDPVFPEAADKSIVAETRGGFSGCCDTS